jgi:Gamma tubulin complex component C-terminal/Gamma tubulin complex component N-terminal
VSGLENSGRIIRSSVFLDSFIRLGLGWNSVLFHYNEQKRSFEKSLRDIRITGISLTALDGMISDISRCGTNVQKIRRFVRVNSSLLEQPSALSSLASAASVLLYSLEKQLSGHLRVNMSLIQVYNLFQKCGDLVSTLAEIITAAERARSESEVISVLLSKCEDHEQRVPWLANTLHEIIHRCTKPWLTLVESWIGLKSEKPLFAEGHTIKNSFVELEYSQAQTSAALKSEVVDYIYHPEFIPSSLPAEQAHLLFETGKALRLLKRNQPDHPISRLDVVEASQAPSLACAFSWGHIEQIQRRAIEYESRLRREIARYNSGDTSRSRPGTQHGPVEHDKKGLYENDLTDNFDLIDFDNGQHVTGLLADNSYMESDKLYQDTEEREFFSPQSLVHYDTAFGPPVGSVLYLSLGPTLAVQAKLVDFSCLHLLFKKHKLRYHLTLQWRFHLLSDGTFASRLSHSLFDPEMTSGERKSGVARGGFHTGLRLGNRDTWPPASSELRLVLMGLLSECYDATENEPALSMHPEPAKGKDLSGNLSFAIRDLTGNELIKCKDPNSIQALDFLRLQYKPSTTIESVITPQSLRKYDMLFKYLLRLLRMVSVVNSLVRDSTTRGSLSGDTHNIFQQFRIESHHFITTLNDYVFQVAIGANWQRFEDTLSEIESCIDNGDIDGTIEIAGSLHRLRKYHEDVLDQILFSLFLEPQDRRQRRRALEQVNRLLEDIFGTILAFMPLSRLDGASGIRNKNEKTVYRLHVTFRKQVGTFVRFLRSVDGKRALSKSKVTQLSGSGNMSAKGTSSIFEYLLVRLDMKQYY